MDIFGALSGIRSLLIASQNVRICWVFGAEENTSEKMTDKRKEIAGFRVIYSRGMLYSPLMKLRGLVDHTAICGPSLCIV